jgi:hypothetical protein
MTTKHITISSRVRIALHDDDYDTPCIVEAKVGGKQYTSTYWCANETGCVGNDDEYKLTAAESEALDSRYDQCSNFFDSVRSN